MGSLGGPLAMLRLPAHLSFLGMPGLPPSALPITQAKRPLICRTWEASAVPHQPSHRTVSPRGFTCTDTVSTWGVPDCEPISLLLKEG